MKFRISLDNVFIVGVIVAAASLVLTAGPKFEADTMKFNHYLHIDQAGLGCADCHSGVEAKTTGQRAMPDHETCAACHEHEVDNACGMCHADADNPVASAGAGVMFAGFAHKSHADPGIKCQSCHGDIKPGTEPSLPSMADCQSCHAQKNGPLACEQCHAGDRPLPSDHKFLTWKQEHGLEARAAASDCASCHTQQSCDACHQGVNLTDTPHPVTWKFDHFTASAFGSECMSCHTTRQFCTDCHRTTRPIPHAMGPIFANAQSGGDHKDDARAFPETCLSCHDRGVKEPTCARCHG